MPKPQVKNMTLRLPLESAQRLEFVASYEGTNMSALIRKMIDDYLEDRRNDPQLRGHLLDSVRQVSEWLGDDDLLLDDGDDGMNDAGDEAPS